MKRLRSAYAQKKCNVVNSLKALTAFDSLAEIAELNKIVLVITFEAKFLLPLKTVITFEANCYYIWSQLLYLRPTVITFEANCYYI